MDSDIEALAERFREKLIRLCEGSGFAIQKYYDEGLKIVLIRSSMDLDELHKAIIQD